jgi:hypothetical protein
MNSCLSAIVTEHRGQFGQSSVRDQKLILIDCFRTVRAGVDSGKRRRLIRTLLSKTVRRLIAVLEDLGKLVVGETA